MHELPLVMSIFKSAMEFVNENNIKEETNIYLQIGVLRDFIPSYITKYWKYVGKGTVLENSNLFIEDIPASAKCSKCNNIYIINPEDIENAKCPHCGYEKGFLISGREVILDRIEIKSDEGK